MSKLNIVGYFCGVISIAVAIMSFFVIEDLNATVSILKMLIAVTAGVEGGLLTKLFLENRRAKNNEFKE